MLRASGEIGGRIKTVEPDNLHLTLKFLGDTRIDMVDDIEGVMNKAVQGIARFDMTLKGVGAFPNKGRPRVLWVGCVGAEALTEVASSIDNGVSKLGFKKEKRRFAAHLTVARVRFSNDRKGFSRFFDRFEDVDLGTVRVDRIRLKKSVLSPKGPTYSIVREIVFGH